MHSGNRELQTSVSDIGLCLLRWGSGEYQGLPIYCGTPSVLADGNGPHMSRASVCHGLAGHSVLVVWTSFEVELLG